MRIVTIALALALGVSGVANAQDAKPAANHGEHMKNGKMQCCEKGEDGKMACKMMDHQQMNHGGDVEPGDAGHDAHGPQAGVGHDPQANSKDHSQH